MNAYYFQMADGSAKAVAAETEEEARALIDGEITKLVNVKPHTPVQYKYPSYEEFCEDMGINPR